MRLRFFFFQAEDGIRGKLVTGVQTCALPICRLGPGWKGVFNYRSSRPSIGRTAGAHPRDAYTTRGMVRSEERRVGKECRSRGAPGHEKKKEEWKGSADGGRDR